MKHNPIEDVLHLVALTIARILSGAGEIYNKAIELTEEEARFARKMLDQAAGILGSKTLINITDELRELVEQDHALATWLDQCEPEDIQPILYQAYARMPAA